MSKQELLDPITDADETDAKMATDEESSSEPTLGHSLEEQLEELTLELDDRDQLIEMLTERLEEAAKQLDRVHRTGADKVLPGTSSPGFQLPSSNGVDSKLNPRLEAMLDGWEEVRADRLLDRIDLRVEKLLDLIQSGNVTAAASNSSSVVRTETADEPEDDAKAAANESAAAWEEMKARLMGGSDSPPTQNGTESTQADNAEKEELEVSIDPPGEVSTDETDVETLQLAIMERDDYISALLAEFRRHQKRDSINWDAVAEAPEELKKSVEELQARLQQDLQREELSLSLERAKVARERAKVQNLRTQFEKEIRQLEIGPNDEATRKQSSKSWLKRLADLAIAGD